MNAAAQFKQPRPDEPRARFLIELARALGTYGTSANRIEEVIAYCADAFGYNAQTFTTPTSVFVSLEDDAGESFGIATGSAATAAGSALVGGGELVEDSATAGGSEPATASAETLGNTTFPPQKMSPPEVVLPASNASMRDSWSGEFGMGGIIAPRPPCGESGVVDIIDSWSVVPGASAIHCGISGS